MPRNRPAMYVAMLLMTLATGPTLGQPADKPPATDAAAWYATGFYRIEYILRRAPDDEALLESATTFQTNEGVEFDVDGAEVALAAFEEWLDWIRRGSEMNRCDWPTTIEEDGPDALLPHLGQMRQASRMFATLAVVLRERGDLAGSTEALLVVMRMARHTASDHLIISVLVQYSIDHIALELLASQLDQYDRQALKALSAQLQGLTDPVTTADGIRAETVFTRWVRRLIQEEGWAGAERRLGMLPRPGRPAPADPAEAQRWLDAMDAAYAQAAEISELPDDQVLQAQQEFEELVIAKGNPLVQVFLPSMLAARRTELRHQTNRAILKAMIAYRLEGVQAFGRVADPVSGRPFKFEATDDGVIITSQLEVRDTPMSVTFPAGCAQPLD